MGIQAFRQKGKATTVGISTKGHFDKIALLPFCLDKRTKRQANSSKRQFAPGQIDNDMPCALHCLSSWAPQGKRAKGKFDNAGC
jgi:hypothetical protein